jgi:hypothetical protein
MANTVTIAAIKTALDGEVDALDTLNSGTPMAKELEAGLRRQVAALLAAGTIAMQSRVEDS